MTASYSDRIATRLCLEAALFVWKRRVGFLLTGWTWIGLLILLNSAMTQALVAFMPARTDNSLPNPASYNLSGFPLHIVLFIAVATALLAYNWHNLVLGRNRRITPVSGWSVEALRYTAKMLVAWLLMPTAGMFLLALFAVPFLGAMDAATVALVMGILAMVLFFYLGSRNLVLSAYLMSGQPNPIARSWKASGRVLAVPAGCIVLLVLVSVLFSSGIAILSGLVALFSPELAGLLGLALGYVAQFTLLAGAVTLSQRVYDWMLEGHYTHVDS